MTLHEEEFGVKAEWNFFATAHGKNACDGLGGTLKRLATRASLQRPYFEQITTPTQLFEWAEQNIQNMNLKYVSLTEYEEEERRLAKSYTNLKPVPSTQKIHHVSPTTIGQITVKYFSLAAEGITYSFRNYDM